MSDAAQVATPIDPRIGALSGFSGGGQPAGGDPSAGGSVAPAPARGGGGSIQAAVAKEWIDAGYSPAAVEGIMRRVKAESSFDPRNIGDGGTSFGLYQHHADRAVRLNEWAQQHGLNPADPIAQTKFAIHEMAGGDPIAAKHRDELKGATDPGQAYGLFTRSFERPAGAPGSEETNLHSTAFGSFSPEAQRMVNAMTHRTDAAAAEYRSALGEAKDLHSLSRSAIARWTAESEKPPANARQAWSQWSGVAIALAAFAPLFARRNMTAALGAAGTMLQAANSADQKTYDDARRAWKDHLDEGLKAIELLHTEAKDIIDNARLSYDSQLSQLKVLSESYGLAQTLDHAGVQKIEDSLRIQKSRRELLDAQNTDSAVRQLDSEWIEQNKPADGKVPANVHAQHMGQVKREVAGTASVGGALTPESAQFMAKQYLAGDRSVMSGLGYGNLGASNRAMLRDAIQAEAKARGMSPEQVATAIAEFEGLKAGERTLGTTAARVGLGLAEAKVFAPMVVEASDKVSRTDFPKLNDLLLAYDRGTGDENVVRLAIAINALQNAYSQVLTRGGVPTDSARATAHEVFDKAYSAGQMRTAVDQVMREIDAAQRAPGIVKQELRGGQATGAPSGPAPPAASPGGNETQSLPPQYQQYQDGYGFRDKGRPGGLWVKRGGQLIWTPGAVEVQP